MNIGICGISGRMGNAILSIVLEQGDSLTAAFDSKLSNLFGASILDLHENGSKNIFINEINKEEISKIDVLIDFSSPIATMKLLEFAMELKKPVVIGTTGFTEDEEKKIKEISKNIPILLSPNMSISVNLLFKLTEIASKTLDKDFDIEIFEAHHRLKKDSPSGTANKLVEIIKTNVDHLSDAKVLPGRDGMVGERSDKEIGVFSMRGGDIIGEHTVFFAGLGERIELTHRATSRNTFAKGAVLGAHFLADKNPGLYSMFDVLGF